MSELTGPKTPEQLRMDTLRRTQKRASNAVKMERNRQKARSAQKAIQQLRAPKPTTLEPIKPVVVKPRAARVVLLKVALLLMGVP
jgi:hypothetical protein